MWYNLGCLVSRQCSYIIIFLSHMNKADIAFYKQLIFRWLWLMHELIKRGLKGRTWIKQTLNFISNLYLDNYSWCMKLIKWGLKSLALWSKGGSTLLLDIKGLIFRRSLWDFFLKNIHNSIEEIKPSAENIEPGRIFYNIFLKIVPRDPF